ncbi:uncharacterized protein LOC129172668 [Dunckerocampus dactyliophorus]|uniref:uncharacterized protein LOC129172668 n=1 Tax=Dunckerocampus dactyliophorus TaxID=161453 RepID=UPI0024071DBD|nr:uncharacterized protein LOC129172668 [Dunckerocampus dactyliophorus]
MVVWVSSGAWLLLLLATAAYCHPFMQGPRSFPSSQASKPKFTPELSVSGAKPRASYNGPNQPARGALPPSGNPWQAPGGPAPSSSLDSAVSHPSDGTNPSGSFAVNAPMVSGSYAHGGHEASSFPSEPFPGPPLPPFHPNYQPGELFRMDKTFERGHDERETKSKGGPQLHPLPPRPLPLDTAAPSGPGFPFPPFQYGFLPYPFDYNFLTGQYPKGTLSHFSTSFEQGRNYNHDVQYEKSDGDDDDDDDPSKNDDYNDPADPIKDDDDDYDAQNLVQPGRFNRWEVSNFRRDPNTYHRQGQVGQPRRSRLTRVRH